MVPKLPGNREIVDRDGDLRRCGEKQRIVDKEAADKLPHQQPANDRQGAGKISGVRADARRGAAAASAAGIPAGSLS